MKTTKIMAAICLFLIVGLLLLATALHAGNVYKVVGHDSHGPICELDRVASSQAPEGAVATTTGPSVTVFNGTMFALATAAVATETYAEGHALHEAVKEGGVEDATAIVQWVSSVLQTVGGIFGATDVE